MMCLLGASGVAVAQEFPALQEIVVTARKRPEAVDRVPLAINAHNGLQLQRASVEGLQTLTQLDPSLYFETMWGGASSSPVMRGQSQPSAAGDNVGVFVDGVYQANRNGIDVELLDIERVEVVHGPQSALHGRSTFAGAINYVTKAPTADRSLGSNLELANGGAAGAQGWLSGPLGADWRGRIAASMRDFDGTISNAAAASARLGGYRREAAALTLLRPGTSAQPWQVELAARLQRGRSDQPAFGAVPFSDYNCGSRNPSSGFWSYYCGDLPVPARIDLSADIPPSAATLDQLRIALSRPIGTLRLSFDSSYYRGDTDAYRDFDGSSVGQEFAVVANVASRNVSRFVNADIVSLQRDFIEEYAGELRVGADRDDGASWLLGLYVSQSHAHSSGAFGVARGNLAANELLAAVQPATPLVAGPASPFNRALVADPARQQVAQSESVNTRQTAAAFAAIDYPLPHDLALHAELRASWERQALNALLANFAPSFGTAIPAQGFHDLTPRVSVSWAAAPTTQFYVSTAKGARSGGINNIPDLPPGEQTYAPEYNWTTELGVRSLLMARTLHLAATLFDIDWRHTQITGLSSSPFIANLITTNTAGLVTRGVEGAIDWMPGGHFAAGVAFSHQRPRFTRGSDDPAGRGFCGITAQNFTSSFCVVGPPRSGVSVGIPVLPYLDGNLVQRAPRTTWNFHVDANVALPQQRTLWMRADLMQQGDVFERPNDGAWYGARTLANLRLGYEHAGWSLEVWARNLTNQRYIKAVASRGAVFFATTPRPLDLLNGEERRFGITLRLQR